MNGITYQAQLDLILKQQERYCNRTWAWVRPSVKYDLYPPRSEECICQCHIYWKAVSKPVCWMYYGHGNTSGSCSISPMPNKVSSSATPLEWNNSHLSWRWQRLTWMQDVYTVISVVLLWPCLDCPILPAPSYTYCNDLQSLWVKLWHNYVWASCRV